MIPADLIQYFFISVLHTRSCLAHAAVMLYDPAAHNSPIHTMYYSVERGSSLSPFSGYRAAAAAAPIL